MRRESEKEIYESEERQADDRMGGNEDEKQLNWLKGKE